MDFQSALVSLAFRAACPFNTEEKVSTVLPLMLLFFSAFAWTQPSPQAPSGRFYYWYQSEITEQWVYVSGSLTEELWEDLYWNIPGLEQRLKRLPHGQSLIASKVESDILSESVSLSIALKGWLEPWTCYFSKRSSQPMEPTGQYHLLQSPGAISLRCSQIEIGDQPLPLQPLADTRQAYPGKVLVVEMSHPSQTDHTQGPSIPVPVGDQKPRQDCLMVDGYPGMDDAPKFDFKPGRGGHSTLMDIYVSFAPLARPNGDAYTRTDENGQTVLVLPVTSGVLIETVDVNGCTSRQVYSKGEALSLLGIEPDETLNFGRSGYLNNRMTIRTPQVITDRELIKETLEVLSSAFGATNPPSQSVPGVISYGGGGSKNSRNPGDSSLTAGGGERGTGNPSGDSSPNENTGNNSGSDGDREKPGASKVQDSGHPAGFLRKASDIMAGVLPTGIIQSDGIMHKGYLVVNPDNSVGGFVGENVMLVGTRENDKLKLTQCFIGENAKVLDEAAIYGAASLQGNASVSGNASVFGNAVLSGNAKVFGEAKVYDEAHVYTLARVCGHAEVYGEAQVHDDALVCDDAKVHGRARIAGFASVFKFAWVLGDAWVYGFAKVAGNASVFGRARVFNNAWVSGNAKVYDDAQIYNDAGVDGYAQVFGDSRVHGNARLSNNDRVSTGDIDSTPHWQIKSDLPDR